jgi:hypothetical protein
MQFLILYRFGLGGAPAPISGDNGGPAFFPNFLSAWQTAGRLREIEPRLLYTVHGAFDPEETAAWTEAPRR